MKRACLLLALLPSWLRAMAAETPRVQNLVHVKSILAEARKAYGHGDLTNALALATQAIELEPASAESWMFRGRLRESARNYSGAAGDFAKVIQLEPGAAEAYVHRGQARFRLGRREMAVEDFDRAVAVAPARAPQLWQRGLALCEVGRYADARKQFEACHTVSSNDVECAAWHFLCVAKTDGVEPARAHVLAVEGDPRVPMPEIWKLLAGQGKPEDIEAAVEAGKPSAFERDVRRFYAGLYLGLFFEATGDLTRARTELARAVAVADKVDYLGDAARLHAAGLVKPEDK